MLKLLTSILLLSQIIHAQSFGVPGWNDLTVNGRGSGRFSQSSAPPITIKASSLRIKLDTSRPDAGRPIILILAAGHAVSPRAISLGFGQCTTLDLVASSILVMPMIGVVPRTGPFIKDYATPAQPLDFSVQAAVTLGGDIFLSQALAVTVEPST